MKIVFLSGQQGSGKSTLQDALYTKIWRDPRKFAFKCNFADPIKDMHDAVLNVLHRFMKPRDIVKDGPLMQVLGTQWGRATLGENIWIDLLKEQIRQSIAMPRKESVPYYIIGDGRFENEFDAFPDALRVRLHCDEEVRKKRCSAWRENTQHASETGLDSYSNNGKFDLYLDTEVCDIEMCSTLVMAQIDKNVWMEKRK